MTTAFSVSSCIEKLNNRDKDFRFMGLSDLLAELGKDSLRLDADSEKKLTQKLLALLEDGNGDVQGMAVKALGSLVKRMSEANVSDVIEKMAGLLLKEKNKDTRDIAALGLSTVLQAVSAKEGAMVVSKLPHRLNAAIANDAVDGDTTLECLNILELVLSRFGQLMGADHAATQKAVLPQLKSSRSAARKRAIGCLSQLATVAADGLFSQLVEHMFQQTESAKAAERKTFVQALGAISVSAGYRLGRYIGQMVPIVAKAIKSAGNEESDDELRENCLQALEALVRRCPKEVTPHLSAIADLSLTYLKHDPNYTGDDGEDDEEAMDEDGDDDEDYDDGDYSADDDASWKVRRASAKVLGAIVATRPELVGTLGYEKIAPALIMRFKEREETVKIDVFSSFVTLLKQTQLLCRRAGAVAGGPISSSSSTTPASTSDRSLLSALRERVPAVVAGIVRQLKDKSVKTRVAAFGLVREVVVTLSGGLDKQVKDLVPGVVFSLADKSTNSNLKIEALTFLRVLLASHAEDVFQPHLTTLQPPLLKAVGESYYKITAEALRACSEVVRVLRPDPAAAKSSFDYKPFVKPLYTAVLARLKAADTDQEVKETAINCMGLLIASLGDELAAELKETLPVLQERLSNEITRLAAVKAWGRIAGSPLKLDVVGALPTVVPELASYLRKLNRQLKQSSLQTLEVIVRHHGKAPQVSSQFAALVPELASLVNDSDLHLAHLALQLATAMLKAHPESLPAVRDQLYPRTLDLVQSSLLQGAALNSLLALLSELVAIGDKKLSFDAQLEALQALTKKQLAKGCASSIAQCIAALVVAAPAKQRDATISSLIKDASNGKEESKQALALMCLGEIGRRHDLSSSTDSVHKAAMAALDSSSDEIKTAGSFALGCVAVGNLPKLLPSLLAEIKAAKRQYLLLQALREVIARAPAGSLTPHVPSILPLLFDNMDSAEEGSRNVVAECTGKLALVATSVIGDCKERLGSFKTAHSRATVVSAVKFAIVEAPHAVDAALADALPVFLGAPLSDPEIEVRRAALLLLNWSTHNKPELVRHALPSAMPALFAEATVRPELLREVDLGPFKHKVDDGLENRKAAFEALNTVLEQLPECIEVPQFVNQLVLGCRDDSYDIRLLVHLTIIRLANTVGAILVDHLEPLVEPLRTTVTHKPAATAVKQEADRADELVRSAMRAVLALEKVENVTSCARFEEFVRTTLKTGELAEKYAQVSASEST